MMTVKAVADRIKALKIQGATNVAIEGLKSLKKTNEKNLEKNIKILSNSRITEPLLFNGLRYIRATYKSSGIDESVDEYIDLIKESKKNAIETCSERIPDKATIMTHCHSSLVVESIIKAKNKGKKPKVIVTDTRPLYQGKITATELAKAKIPVTFVVDSAARRFMNDCNLFLMGSDAITANSYFVNKIGSSLMALAAKEAKTEVGVAVQLLKADTRTIKGEMKIEERAASEVWKKPPKGIDIKNPAFDMTPATHIDFVASEFGILSAYTAFQVAQQKYPWIMEGEKWY